MPLLLRDVCVRFGPTIALDRVSFEFPSHGIIALIGENGAGKSTVLDVLSGFIGTSSGEVMDSGNRRRISRLWLRDQSARLHQANVLPVLLTPAEYLRVVRFPEKAQWLVARGPSREGRIMEFLPQSVALILDNATINLDRPIALHSLGQQRAIALAAAIIVRKPVLLLDEPFSSLSRDVMEHASRVIQDEAEHRLVVFAEHDIFHAMEIAETVLVLKTGQLKATLPSAKHHYSELLQYFG